MLRWLARDLMRCSYHYALCTGEDAFRRELKRLELPCEDWPKWLINHPSDASTHFFEHGKTGNHVAIVCIRAKEGISGIQVASLLTHEAVHIWQAHCEDIGETQPGKEEEAYAIQSIAQELMLAYRDSLQKPKRRK